VVTIDLKGIHEVRSKGKTYYYAWRGGPRIKAIPGTHEFQKAYLEAIEDLKTTGDEAKFKSVVASYKASHAYKKLAKSTKRNWGPKLDEISSHFGSLRTAQFDRTDKIRPKIIKWRAKWAEQPRTADYYMQVLSRVCAHGVDPLAVIATNPCEGIKRLYSSDRSEIIWTPEDLKQLYSECSIEVQWACELAAHTGMRLGDLVRLSWSHIGENAIVITTGKSSHKRTAIIPLYGALRTLLNSIPKRSTTVLTNSFKRPWTENSFGTAMDRSKRDAKLMERDLHFHDLKGTAVTKFYLASIPVRVIAEIVGWEEETVEKIIRRYVGRDAATKNLIRMIDAARNDK
jgi:integrase